MKNTYSRIISGAMSWGTWGRNLAEQEMISLMHHCIENEITTIDHADIYGGYTTEEAFGHALSKSGINREQIQLISKCGIQYMAEKRNNTVKHYDLSKKYILWSVDESLKNLKTDYLDLLLLHRPSPLMQPEEIGEAVERLSADGKIKDFGVSNFTPSQTDLLESKIKVHVNQIQFSLTHYEPMLDGTLDHMMKNSIVPMVWSPLGSVFREENEQTYRIKKLLEMLCEKYAATADQLLLAWILKHPSGIHPVVGTTDKSRIVAAMKATKIELEQEDWFKMWVESQGHKVP